MKKLILAATAAAVLATVAVDTAEAQGRRGHRHRGSDVVVTQPGIDPLTLLALSGGMTGAGGNPLALLAITGALSGQTTVTETRRGRRR